MRVAHYESCIAGRPLTYRLTVRNCGETVVIAGAFHGMGRSAQCLVGGQDPSFCQDVVTFRVPACTAPNAGP